MTVTWNQCSINTLRPRQDGRHFPDDFFKYILFNENVCIFVTISLKCVAKGSINYIPSSVQIMAWCRSGDKPLSGPMMALFIDAYMRQSASMSLKRQRLVHCKLTEPELAVRLYCACTELVSSLNLCHRWYVISNKPPLSHAGVKSNTLVWDHIFQSSGSNKRIPRKSGTLSSDWEWAAHSHKCQCPF